MKHIEVRDTEVRTIYLELDDKCARQLRMSGSDIITNNNKWVPYWYYNGANINLQDIFSNYTLLVNEPTHISRSLIDHVYDYNESLQKFLPSKTEVLIIYFSDHDAVKFRLQWN